MLMRVMKILMICWKRWQIKRLMIKLIKHPTFSRLESLDTGAIWKVGEVGTYNSMVFSYALTVHKSQGSEWRRVFLFLHSSHHAMCSRELVYTAVTRAREDLIILCEPDRRDSKGTLSKAALNPRIKGNTLKEKLEWLKKRSDERLKNGRKEEDDEQLIGK
jgi:ATP-dependent exoDNAse (exonuclease V) alpha subunit